MDELDVIRERLKSKRAKMIGSNNNEDNDAKTKYVRNLITRVLLAVILFLTILIVMNLSDDVKSFINVDVLKENISFSKVSNLYNKYFGNVLPIKEEGLESKTVFNESITYNKLTDYKDGYELTVSDNYIVPIIKSGIVVFIGDKENYGRTVIIQGNNEIDYWYGNLDSVNISLYDIVNSGEILGSIKDNKLYLVFQKNNEFLSYDEVME